jgi:pimeloyl-ACP methyl ester carboxylesterase
MKARFHRVLLAFAAIALLSLLAITLNFVVLRGRTPAIPDSGSIASLEKQQIGGVDQWVLIRGRDRTNPVLLFLHGGPGMPAMYLAHEFQSELERDFVIVHWDRRGAGKSFDARLQTPAFSVRQTLSDTYELTEKLRVRFHQQRIYLAGHSWGSYLGLLAIREHPEYYTAFIGMGVPAGSRDQVRVLQREFLSRTATDTANPNLKAHLTGATMEVREDDLFECGGELYASRSFWPILKAGLSAPEYTLRDAMNVKKGADLLNHEMKYDVVPGLLEGEILRVGVPVFFFLGRHDFNTPSRLAAEYLARLDAPLKGLVWFDHSAHFPFFEESDLFRKEMVRVEHEAQVFWISQALEDLTARPAINKSLQATRDGVSSSASR